MAVIGNACWTSTFSSVIHVGLSQPTYHEPTCHKMYTRVGLRNGDGPTERRASSLRQVRQRGGGGLLRGHPTPPLSQASRRQSGLGTGTEGHESVAEAHDRSGWESHGLRKTAGNVAEAKGPQDVSASVAVSKVSDCYFRSPQNGHSSELVHGNGMAKETRGFGNAEDRCCQDSGSADEHARYPADHRLPIGSSPRPRMQ